MFIKLTPVIIHKQKSRGRHLCDTAAEKNQKFCHGPTYRDVRSHAEPAPLEWWTRLSMGIQKEAPYALQKFPAALNTATCGVSFQPQV